MIGSQASALASVFEAELSQDEERSSGTKGGEKRHWIVSKLIDIRMEAGGKPSSKTGTGHIPTRILEIPEITRRLFILHCANCANDRTKEQSNRISQEMKTKNGDILPTTRE